MDLKEDEKLKIATFRFGVIADFVTGIKLEYGDRERLLLGKIGREYTIPFSTRARITRSTIEKWISDYKKAGFRLEGLYPQSRKDKGQSRVLSNSIKLAIMEFKKENPRIKLPALITTLRHKKLIGSEEYVNPSTVYRFLKTQELQAPNENAVDKRLFEAQYPNGIWQSDVLHGPYVKVDGKSKKSYLIAIIDDHSRFIIHAGFYLNEAKESFLDCLRQGILKRGLPQVLYIDNGSCFKTLHLEQVAAQLGFAIKHSRPYIPQGRGKIERWFKYVRDSFLSLSHLSTNHEKLDLLNHYFADWLEAYNNKVHGTTKQSPYKRYSSQLECIRPAPVHLLDYFRQIEFRHVKKDRTIRLMGHIFEVPVSLINRKVELRFHPEDLSQIEIFFSGKSYGVAMKVDPYVNSVIGRNWATKAKKAQEVELLKSETPTPTGKLFKTVEEDI